MKFFRLQGGPLERFDFETLKALKSFIHLRQIPSGARIIKISCHTDADGRIHWKQKVLKRF